MIRSNKHTTVSVGVDVTVLFVAVAKENYLLETLIAEFQDHSGYVVIFVICIQYQKNQ